MAIPRGMARACKIAWPRNLCYCEFKLRHSMGETPVDCLNAWGNAEQRVQPRRVTTCATEQHPTSMLLARSKRRALAQWPMPCSVSREKAEHRCDLLTNSMFASSSRVGARPSSIVRSMGACASRTLEVGLRWTRIVNYSRRAQLFPYRRVLRCTVQ